MHPSTPTEDAPYEPREKPEPADYKDQPILPPRRLDDQEPA